MNNSEKYKNIPGLDVQESEAYYALLGLKKTTISGLSLICKIKRPTLYRIVDRLIEKGLVSQVYEGKKRWFIAENPSRILKNIKDEEKRFQAILPKLISLEEESAKRPKIKYFEGKNGIKVLYAEILKDTKELVAFSNPTKLIEEIEFHHEFIQKRMTNNIPVRIILPDNRAGRQRKKSGIAELRFVALSKYFIPSDCVYIISDAKIMMYSLKSWYTGVLIEDKELAKGLKMFFEAFWATLNSND